MVVANHAVGGTLQAQAMVVLAILCTLAFFMVSTIKFRSFKDLKLNVRTITMIAIAVGSSAALAILYHPSFALVALLTAYLAMGVGELLFNLSRHGLKRRDEVEDEET